VGLAELVLGTEWVWLNLCVWRMGYHWLNDVVYVMVFMGISKSCVAIVLVCCMWVGVIWGLHEPVWLEDWGSILAQIGEILHC